MKKILEAENASINVIQYSILKQAFPCPSIIWSLDSEFLIEKVLFTELLKQQFKLYETLF